MIKWLKRLPHYVGIGNVRYTTSRRMDRASLFRDAQLVIAEMGKMKIAISFNGNIVNVRQLRKEILKKNSSLGISSDTRILYNKLCLEYRECGQDLNQAVENCLWDVEGAYSAIAS